jgi:hypothetical protein
MSGAPRWVSERNPISEEVTPEMINAGVHAYYENAIYGWDNPGQRQLEDMLRSIYAAMAACSRQQ